MERPEFMESLQGIVDLLGAIMDGSAVERLHIEFEESDDRLIPLMRDVSDIQDVMSVNTGGHGDLASRERARGSVRIRWSSVSS